MNTITLTEFDKFKTLADARTALFADDTYTELTEHTTDVRGQLRSVTVTKNLLTDEVVETVTTEWTYNERGEVDQIVTSRKDKADKLTGDTVTVKHYADKQPTVSIVGVGVKHG